MRKTFTSAAISTVAQGGWFVHVCKPVCVVDIASRQRAALGDPRVRVERPRDVEFVRHDVSVGPVGTRRVALHCAHHDGVGGASVVASRGSLPRSDRRVPKRRGAHPGRFVVDAVGGRPRPRRARGHVDRARSAVWIRGARRPRANARLERKHGRGNVCLRILDLYQCSIQIHRIGVDS